MKDYQPKQEIVTKRIVLVSAKIKLLHSESFLIVSGGLYLRNKPEKSPTVCKSLTNMITLSCI